MPRTGKALPCGVLPAHYHFGTPEVMMLQGLCDLPQSHSGRHGVALRLAPRPAAVVPKVRRWPTRTKVSVPSKRRPAQPRELLQHSAAQQGPLALFPSWMIFFKVQEGIGEKHPHTKLIVGLGLQQKTGLELPAIAGFRSQGARSGLAHPRLQGPRTVRFNVARKPCRAVR